VTFLSSVLSDPKAFRILLISIGIILSALIYYAHRKKQARIAKFKESASPPVPDNSESSSSSEQAEPEVPPDNAISNAAPEAPDFATLQRRPWMLIDLLRVLLIILSLAVAAGLAVVLLPQSAVDSIVQSLQARHASANPEQIAFLYLGDEVAGNELRIRGVVRNITTVPIEQLDASIRLYAPDRTLLETTIVRMNKETIDPGDIAQFELVYPNYKSEFGSYSVEFKSRPGIVVPYKDMRTMQVQSGSMK
jgi:hypothetical protein